MTRMGLTPSAPAWRSSASARMETPSTQSTTTSAPRVPWTSFGGALTMAIRNALPVSAVSRAGLLEGHASYRQFSVGRIACHPVRPRGTSAAQRAR